MIWTPQFLVCPEFRKRGSILRYAVHASGVVVMNHGCFSHLKSSYGALPLTSWDAHPSSIWKHASKAGARWPPRVLAAAVLASLTWPFVLRSGRDNRPDVRQAAGWMGRWGMVRVLAWGLVRCSWTSLQGPYDKDDEQVKSQEDEDEDYIDYMYIYIYICEIWWYQLYM